MTGEFEIDKDDGGRFRFTFKIGERALLCSRLYKSKYNCTIGIASVRNHSSNAANFVEERTGNGNYRVKLLARNGRVLGVSEDHESASGYENEIAYIRELVPAARINDRTLTDYQKRKLRSLQATGISWPCRIYAAPRDRHGVYRPHGSKMLSMQVFNSESARNDFWNRWIRPVTADTAGAEYEYVMCDYPSNGRWHFVSERRYSNAKLIDGHAGQNCSDVSPARTVRYAS